MQDESLPKVHSATKHMAHLAHCDCACVLEPPLGPVAPSLSGPWTTDTRTVSVDLKQEWRAYFNPRGPVGVAVLNRAAQRLLSQFEPSVVPDRLAGQLPDIPEPALQQVVTDLAAIGLIQPLEGQAPAPCSSTTLSAWLHVTEACNLACPYCYVSKSPRAMSFDLARHAATRLVEMAQRYGYRKLRLKYAGGEPTLHFGLVREVHGQASYQAEQADIELEEVLLTNGASVADEVLDTIAAADMRLMVSLDGGPAAHDRLRMRREGDGTFGAVVSTIDRALARGLVPDISITITSLNLDGVAGAARVALERNLPFNLNFYRECTPAGKQGRREVETLAPPPGRLVAVILDLFDLVRQFPAYPHPLSGILDRARLDLPHDGACSAGSDYLVVGVRGAIAGCQMLLGSPWANLSDEDPLDAVRKQGRLIFQQPGEGSDCARCTWRRACGGGCPLLRGSDLHDRYCAVYRALFPELLRLEGERLLAMEPAPLP
ncbi:MAG: radical SAM protein [Anaerolineae bacterium]|nr:radical SAM protein [Anaerolineae bacterium]MDX9831129.1 radical SAM protein [Anaerolineae bacterium]